MNRVRVCHHVQPKMRKQFLAPAANLSQTQNGNAQQIEQKNMQYDNNHLSEREKKRIQIFLNHHKPTNPQPEGERWIM